MAISISNNNPTISYTVASGQSQTQFTVPFAFFDDVDLDVFVNGTLQTITTHYTVAGGDGSTGTITFASAVSGPATVVINRDTIIQRSSDFPISGPFNISSLNDDLDRQILIQAELDKGIERSIKIPAGETTTTVLPAAAERADQFLVFDSNGNITTSSEVVLTTLTVDNINLDGNTISTVDTDGNLILDPNGAGVTSITGAATVSDTITSFGFRSGSSNTAYNLFAAGGPTVANYIQSSGSSHILEIRKGSQTAGAGDAVARFDSVGDVIFYGDGRTLRWSGANNYLQFTDDTKAIFGSGQDLQIWHDSIKQASFISDNGPYQKIYIESGTVSLRKPGGTELMAEFAADGAVKLYYDNVETLTTSATGVSIVGNIDVSGTVDGRDIATDGTKLDNIEAGADVTDTDNVVAALTAGSNITIAADGTISSTTSVEGNVYNAGTGLTLTDNEFSVTNPFTDADELKLDNIEANADVTDTTNVVAALTAGTNITIAADGTISATNTDTTYTAGTGLTLTGTEFSVTNPFTDADELKLDNIEDGATADQTAAEILTAIKTVDGATSGLDSDRLDGQEGSYYLDYNNINNTPTANDVLNQIKTVDGIGSGLDADRLDGQEGSHYLNASTQFGGDVSGTYDNITVTNNSHTHDDRYYTETQADDRFVNVTGDTMSGNLTIDQGNSGDAIFTLRSNVANTQQGDHPSIRFKQEADAVDWRLGIGTTDTDVSTDHSQKLIFTSVDGNADAESLAFSPDNGNSLVYTIFNDGYHPNADTWTTARTLSLSGDATGSVSLDGSADANISVTLTSTAFDSDYVNLTGDTMTGTLTLDADSSGTILKSTNSSYSSNGQGDDQFFVRHNFRAVEIGSTEGDFDIIQSYGNFVNIVGENGKTAAKFYGAGGQRIYHDGDVRFSTVTGGIDITGEEIQFKSGAGTTQPPKFIFINEDTTVGSSDYIGSIEFESSSSFTDASGQVAYIKGIFTSSSGNTALTFGTFNNIVSQDDITEERMRITAEGRVGIGTVAPTALLDVNGVARIRNGLELAGGGLFTGNIDVTGTVTADGLSVDGGTIKLDGNYPVGTDNVALGDGALSSGSLTGGFNVAIGDNALASNTTGSQNIGIGYYSANNTTTGAQNIAIGRNSLVTNITGSYNVAIGDLALQANTASNNTAVGYQAAYTNQTGTDNTVVGYQAARLLTASETTAIGTEALGSCTSGARNTAVGQVSMAATTIGSENTAIGRLSLRLNTEGSNNVAVGHEALYSNETANANTAVGYQAGYANTTGTDLTAVGYLAGTAATTSSSSVFVGSYAGQAITIGTSNTVVGRTALRTATIASNNVAIGNDTLEIATGDSNTFVGSRAGVSMTTGSKNTVIGRYTGNQGGLDIRTSSNNIVLSDGDGNPRMFSDPSGRFNINRSSTYNARLALDETADGNIACAVFASSAGYYNQVLQIGCARGGTTGYNLIQALNSTNTECFKVDGYGDVKNTNNSYGAISDEKLKENIVDSGSQWDDIKALRVRKYSMKADALDAPNKLGVIAQELEAAGMSGLVSETPDRDDDGTDLGTVTKAVAYSVLYMKAVKALQEAMERIETLEAKVTALENA